MTLPSSASSSQAARASADVVRPVLAPLIEGHRHLGDRAVLVAAPQAGDGGRRGEQVIGEGPHVEVGAWCREIELVFGDGTDDLGRRAHRTGEQDTGIVSLGCHGTMMRLGTGQHVAGL